MICVHSFLILQMNTFFFFGKILGDLQKVFDKVFLGFEFGQN